jgi:hypothetical protein
MAARHRERHRTDRIDWLRAAVLVANNKIKRTQVQSQQAAA